MIVERARSEGKAGLALTLRALAVEACVVLAGTVFFLFLAAMGVPKVELRVDESSPSESHRESQVYKKVEELLNMSALTRFDPGQ